MGHMKLTKVKTEETAKLEINIWEGQKDYLKPQRIDKINWSSGGKQRSDLNVKKCQYSEVK